MIVPTAYLILSLLVATALGWFLRVVCYGPEWIDGYRAGLRASRNPRMDDDEFFK
jgi:hypothetical protein